MPDLSYVVTVATAIAATAWLSTRTKHWLRGKRPRTTRHHKPPDLRASAFSYTLYAGSDDNACCMMDWTLEKDAATLVSFSDGTTSLYWSTGGGIIGAGAHATVAEPAARFRALVSQAPFQQELAEIPTLPPPNHVAFHLLSRARAVTSDSLPLKTIDGTPFSAAHRSAQETIAAIRAVSAPAT